MCNSGVTCVPALCEALGSVPQCFSTVKKPKVWKIARVSLFYLRDKQEIGKNSYISFS